MTNKTKAALALALAAAIGLVAVPGASAEFTKKENFGEHTSEPSFARVGAMAVDPATSDLLVLDGGANEEQRIEFTNFHEGDRFKLTWTPPGGSAATTEEITFNSSTFSHAIQVALEAKFGASNILVPNSGFNHVFVEFTGVYAKASQSLISCAVVVGSGSCSAQRLTSGGPAGVFRYKPNGEADPFSALGSSLIDAKGGADESPQGGFDEPTRIAVDGACVEHEPLLTGSQCEAFDPADGDIYVSDRASDVVDVFSASGEYLGQLTEANSDEIQKLEFTGFSEGEEFSLSGLPGSCSGSVGPGVHFSPAFASPLRAALETRCGGGSFGLNPTIGLRIEFTGELGDSDQEQLNCFPVHFSRAVGTCHGSTLVPGDATHNEVQQITFEDFSPGEEFQFERLISVPHEPCGKVSPQTPYASTLVADVRKGLEILCPSGSFSVSVDQASATIDFAGPLGAADQNQLSCTPSGAGSCALITSQDGGQPRSLILSGEGLAVGEAGSIYVGDHDNNEIHEFLPISTSPFQVESRTNFYSPKVQFLASDAGLAAGSIFASNRHAMAKLNAASGAEECAVTQEGTLSPAAMAVNQKTGHVLVRNEISGHIEEQDGACPLSGSGSFAFGAGTFTIDGFEGFLYLSENEGRKVVVYREAGLARAQTLPSAPIGLTSATLNGEVDPNGAGLTECFFEWGETKSYGHTLSCAEYESEGAWHTISSLADLGAGVAFVPVRAQIPAGELEAGSSYHVQLRAANPNNETPAAGGDQTFLTHGPRLRAEAASEVGEGDAVLSAEVKPNGKPTTYQVEYVTEAQFEETEWLGAEAVPAPPVSVGQGSEFVPAVQHISGLAPATTYYFRFVATNPEGANEGTGGRFTTFPVTPEGLGLLDGRAYELVTPVAKKGQPIPPEPDEELGGSCDPTNPCLPGAAEIGQAMQAAPDGESVLYSGQAFAAGLASGRNTYISGRTSSGWNWGSISPRTQAGAWEACSPDLSRCVLSQVEPPLSPETPMRGGQGFADLYLRDGTNPLTPLVMAEPPNRDPGGASDDFNVNFVAANVGTSAEGAFEHIVFEANDALTAAVPGVAPAAPSVQAGPCAAPSSTESVFCDLYEWAGGRLSLVNVAPGNGAALGKAVIGSGRLLERNATYEAPSVDNAISADGRTIFWTSEETGHAYARIDGEHTLEVPGPATCKASVPLSSRACFLTASKDGSEVLLSNGELFALDGAGTAYVLREGKDLIEGKGGFEGYLATGEEGENITRVYFADRKVLPGAAANKQGESASEEEHHTNLYYWHNGTLRFVASLLEGDNGIARGFGGWRGAQADRTAQATPDGRYLTFMSKAPLTGYDNTRLGGGHCSASDGSSVCAEVFEYAVEGGVLACPSCNPTGEAPLGSSNLTRIWPNDGAPDFRQPQNLPAAGEGRIFFESQDTLSPQDRNGSIRDVYEWEPKGVGNCVSEETESGCLGLISSGRSETDSAFLDATPSGADAFFITRSKLLPLDKNEQLDLYDVRAPHVPGETVGFPEEVKPPICEDDACRGPASEAPSSPGAASATFVGPGEHSGKLICPKGYAAKHGKCVAKHKPHKKQKHKRGHKGKKNRRADHDRGDGR
jgi:hypothetical protein